MIPSFVWRILQRQHKKDLVYIYEKMSELKVIFNKSVIMVCSDEQKAIAYS
jgi:hypothetical protein